MTKRTCPLCNLELDELEAEELIQNVKMLKAAVEYLEIEVGEIKKRVGKLEKKTKVSK